MDGKFYVFMPCNLMIYSVIMGYFEYLFGFDKLLVEGNEVSLIRHDSVVHIEYFIAHQTSLGKMVVRFYIKSN